MLLYRPEGGAKQFVAAHFVSHDTTKEVAAFLQIDASLSGSAGNEITQREVAADPRTGRCRSEGKSIRASWANGSSLAGHELGRIEIDATDPASPKRAAEFIRRHAPAPADAREKWEEAFARQSGRKVWVRISQRYCGPCFRLTRWLDDEKDLLSRGFFRVPLKIDDMRDLQRSRSRRSGPPGRRRSRRPVFRDLRFEWRDVDYQRVALGQYRAPQRIRGEETPPQDAGGDAQPADGAADRCDRQLF